MYFVSYLPFTYFGDDTQYAEVTAKAKFGMSLVPNLAMSVGCKTLAQYESTGNFITSISAPVILYSEIYKLLLSVSDTGQQTTVPMKNTYLVKDGKLIEGVQQRATNYRGATTAEKLRGGARFGSQSMLYVVSFSSVICIMLCSFVECNAIVFFSFPFFSFLF